MFRFLLPRSGHSTLSAQGKDPLPPPAGSTSPDVGHEVAGLLCNCWLLFSIASSRTSGSSSAGRPSAGPGACSCFSPGWDIVFPHAEPHESPDLRPPQLPLDGSTTIWSTNHSSPFCVACKFTVDALHLRTTCPQVGFVPLSAGFWTKPFRWLQPISPLIYPSVFCQHA